MEKENTPAQHPPHVSGTIKTLTDVIEWYGEQARLARLIHSEGDAGRQALAKDGGKKAREVLAVIQPDPQPVASEPVARVRHKKRGTEYAVIGRGKLQTDTPLTDYSEVVAYRGAEGDVWVRPASEFDDGRFEPLPAATPSSAHASVAEAKRLILTIAALSTCESTRETARAALQQTERDR